MSGFPHPPASNTLCAYEDGASVDVHRWKAVRPPRYRAYLSKLTPPATHTPHTPPHHLRAPLRQPNNWRPVPPHEKWIALRADTHTTHLGVVPDNSANDQNPPAILTSEATLHPL